ncbi:MAG: CapA family protein, partial [Anaerolineales bacterium]|nr:CapA family protein [Anaerolineales bacterium]
ALTRATAWAIERNGIDWAVGAIEPWFRTSDVVHVSHEVSFATDCPPVNPSRDIMRFCGQPEQIEVLERIGTDVVELTGNHVMDWGPEAFLYSLDAYRSRGWSTYGGGENLGEAWQPARIEHNGHRLAFVGCNEPGPGFAWATNDGPGATPCDMGRLHGEISALRAEGYLPIVTFQWAESYRRWPVPKQAEAFREAAQAGALIVSGSQAHQAQGFEFIDGAFIHYGPGNLFFDQMWSLETRQEFIVRYVLYAGSLVSVDLHTALLEEFARPRPMTEAERGAFLREIFSASGW